MAVEWCGAPPENGDRCHSTFYEILRGFAQVETGSATRSRFEIKMRRSPGESFELVLLMNALKAIVEGRRCVGSEEIKLNFLKRKGVWSESRFRSLNRDAGKI